MRSVTFTANNYITLLNSGAEFFPELILAFDGAQEEIWLETYIFDFSGDSMEVAYALERAARRGVDVLVVVVSGRGELTLDGQVHPLAPMALVHVPKGTVRAVVAVDGPLAYLSVHRRRSSGLQVGRHAPHHPPNGH